MLALARNALVVLGRERGDARLATVLEAAGLYSWWDGRARDAEDLFMRGVELALRTRDTARAQRVLFLDAVAIVHGPTPLTTAAEQLGRVSTGLRDTGFGQLGALILAAHCHAHAGEFVEARRELAEARDLSEELGLVLQTVGTLGERVGYVELLAGDLRAAERALREGFDRVEALGLNANLSTVATMLADALARQGRKEEAQEMLDRADDLAEPGDFEPQVRLRSVRAQILANRGELVEAERLAREAVEIASRTDWLVHRGAALAALADVLGSAGAVEEAADALREAIELFEEKESAVLAEETRERLAALTAREGVR